LWDLVWSHLYSFSFAPNPNWTREYPEQTEIHDYLVSVAEKWGLYRHIRFNKAVQEARWSEKEHKWKILVKIGGGKEAEYGDEYTVTSDFRVLGVGQLNIPQYPDIPGLERYSGKAMHSSRWDWRYSLEGKRVGIIGNGATAAQIIPEIAKTCKSLTVFQRTPNWVTP
jgi:cation diffusion facilitator CzcD-associated flavoprotein CzcO